MNALLVSILLFVNSIMGTSEPEKGKWVWLFDGTSLDHWVSARSNGLPSQGWEIDGKTLVVNKGGDKTKRGGDIITKKQYSSFELEFEFKLSPGANSGLKYLVKKYPNGSIYGFEYQLIDDLGNKDIANDANDKRRTASLYELFEPSQRKLKPIGEWNKVRIVLHGNHGEHWLNGTKVVEYVRGSKEFLKARAASKFKDIEDFGLVKEGYIMLTDHGDEAAYRNIRIREL